MTGRPSTFSQDVADDICERLSEGKSLRSICTADDMPSASTVFKWLRDVDEFAKQYAYARDTQAEAHADEIVDISDNEPDPQKARVRIDARKWVAAKLKPKKYGDRVEIEHSGSVSTLTDEQVDARLAVLVGKAGTDLTAGREGAEAQPESAG